MPLFRGVGKQFFSAHEAKLLEGQLFDTASVAEQSLELVIKKGGQKHFSLTGQAQSAGLCWWAR